EQRGGDGRPNRVARIERAVRPQVDDVPVACRQLLARPARALRVEHQAASEHEVVELLEDVREAPLELVDDRELVRIPPGSGAQARHEVLRTLQGIARHTTSPPSGSAAFTLRSDARQRCPRFAAHSADRPRRHAKRNTVYTAITS